MASDNHLSKLKATCRTCHQLIKLEHHSTIARPASDYVIELKNLFGVDVSQDNPHVHPKSLCDKCRRKLDRCRAATKAGSKVCVVGVLPNYSLHTNDCKVCYRPKSNKDKHTPFTVSFVKSDTPSGFSDSCATEICTDAVETLSSSAEFSLKDVSAAAAEFGFQELGLFEGMSLSSFFSKVRISSGSPQLSLSFAVDKRLKWTVFAFDKPVSANNPLLCRFDPILSWDNLHHFLGVLREAIVCPGNNDFPHQVAKKIEAGADFVFRTRDGTPKARLETRTLLSVDAFSTIRTIECHILIHTSQSRCPPCVSDRKVLLTMKSRAVPGASKKQSKFTPNSKLSWAQLRLKSAGLQRDIQALRKSNSRLAAKIHEAVKLESIEVGAEISPLMHSVITKGHSDFPEGSLPALLWQQQKQQAQANPKSMKWHPLIIRWCISIYLKSPGTYEHLRRTGFLALPHRSTLSQFFNFTTPKAGFNPDTIDRFCADIKVDSLSSHERNISLMFDEMKIKSGLVFNKATGRLVGFCEVGDINKEINDFTKHLNSSENTNLATHVLCIMARGLVSNILHPVGFFPAEGFDSNQLYPVIWEATRIMESNGLQVRCFVSDGASPNRRFYKLHKLADQVNVSEDGVLFWTWNRYDADSVPGNQRKIFFICDVPHLVKTTRNNLENSGGNNMTRNLMLNGQRISWQHIVALYEEDLGMHRHAPGLRRLHKLTEDHIKLSPRLRMRVYLAVQVLSKTVADALEFQGKDYTICTQRFIRYIDRFFDMLNVTRVKDSEYSRKPDLRKYDSVDDPRFKWLIDDFLKFLNDWKDEADHIEGLSQDERNRLCLSYQTLEGYRITVRSFVELTKVLLQIDGVDYFLSDKLNQDPLEEYFGKQRMRGGANENPSVLEFGYNALKLQVASDPMIRVMHGNTRGRRREDQQLRIDDFSELPKRPKRKRQGND